MAAYCQVYGVIHFMSPAGWLPVHWDQLRAQRSVTSMGKLYLSLPHCAIPLTNRRQGFLCRRSANTDWWLFCDAPSVFSRGRKTTQLQLQVTSIVEPQQKWAVRVSAFGNSQITGSRRQPWSGLKGLLAILGLGDFDDRRYQDWYTFWEGDRIPDFKWVQQDI